jgi:hypothetical protein
VTGCRLPAAKALTIRQPWAWATIYGGKDIENRRWRTTYRGPLLIHAGQRVDLAATEELLWTMADPESIGLPRAAWEARGAFIGVVFLADILTDSPSRWAIPGWYHWVLEFPSPIEPAVRYRGRQRLWTPPAAAVEAVADVL